MYNITYTERVMQLLSEHGGYEGSLFYALRDLVDEYESTRFYLNREPLKLSEMSDRHRHPVSGETRGWSYRHTQYRALDTITGGMRQGWLYMITGKSGSGKSRLLFNLALQLSSYMDNKVLYFSLKTDTAGVARRFYASITARHLDETGPFDPDGDFHGLGDLYHPSAQNYKLYLQDLNSRSIGALVHQITYCSRELGIKYVFIDDPEELFAGSPPHILPHRRRWLYERLKEVCLSSGVCIVMARRSEAGEPERSMFGNRLYDLENMGYHLENIDVVFHVGTRAGHPWFDPIRQVNILKYPRPLNYKRFYLYQDERLELIRDAVASDFPREPKKGIYFGIEEFEEMLGNEEPDDESGSQAPY